MTLIRRIKTTTEFLKAEGQFKAKPVFIEKKGPFGQRLISNDIDFSNPNELHYGNDIMVMANPYMAGDKGLPQPVIALLMAGCIAAALSTAAGLLLVLSTSVSHDLMKKIIKPDISDKQEMRYARFASLGAVLDRGLLRDQPSLQLCCQNGGLCLRVGRIFLLSHFDHGNFLEKSKQTWGHSGNDYRNRIYLWLHRLFSISHRQQGILVWYIARRYWLCRNADQLLRSLCRELSYASPAAGSSGHGREHSDTQGGRPGIRALIL